MNWIAEDWIVMDWIVVDWIAMGWIAVDWCKVQCCDDWLKSVLYLLCLYLKVYDLDMQLNVIITLNYTLRLVIHEHLC